MQDIGIGCLYTATKTEDNPVRLDVLCEKSAEFLLGFDAANCAAEAAAFKAQASASLKQSVLRAEKDVLRVLCFDVEVLLPHPFIWYFACEAAQPLECIWRACVHCNDLFCVADVLTFDALFLAAALVLGAAVHFDATHHQFEALCAKMAQIYGRLTKTSDVEANDVSVERVANFFAFLHDHPVIGQAFAAKRSIAK